MCNFMGVRVSKVQFLELKQIEIELGTLAALRELELMKDGFTYSNSLIIRKQGENKVEAVSAHWEFIPPWIRSIEALKQARKQGIPWLNATSEKLLESKLFRQAALQRRCLVLCSHFFEWRHYTAVGEKKAKTYPYCIGLKEKDYFYLAGIWQNWTDKETGENMDTFAIVTTRANALLEQVHNTKKRMPTILTEELAYEWIMSDGLEEERIRTIAAFQMPPEKMYAYSIAKEFKVMEEPCEPFAYEALPELEVVV